MTIPSTFQKRPFSIIVLLLVFFFAPIILFSPPEADFCRLSPPPPKKKSNGENQLDIVVRFQSCLCCVAQYFHANSIDLSLILLILEIGCCFLSVETPTRFRSHSLQSASRKKETATQPPNHFFLRRKRKRKAHNWRKNGAFFG